LRTLHLKGRVFSGKGGGAKFVCLAWVRKQIEDKLGFSPYAGTLNIRLTGESVEIKRTLVEAPGLEIAPAVGYFAGKLFRANLMSVECAVVIPEVPGYPEDVIEVISPRNLRRKLHLIDGSPCEVEVTV
jgi:riboflavin kinase